MIVVTATSLPSLKVDSKIIFKVYVVDSQRIQNVIKFAQGNEVVLVSSLMGNEFSICDLHEEASDAMYLHKVNVHGTHLINVKSVILTLLPELRSKFI